MRRIEAMLGDGRPLRMLDLGCGQARNFLPLLDRHPGLDYTGVEPSPSEAAAARELLGGRANARIVTSLVPAPAVTGTFDLVVSLSVLEHVKHLERFLRWSAERTAPGGTVAHLYDLGHALTPATLRERLHVRAGSTPVLWRAVPERRFTAYVSQARVREMLARAGVEVTEVTHHNGPEHVRLLKALDESPAAHEVLDRVIALEAAATPLVARLPARVREPLFPSVCVWGRRR